MSSLTVIGSGLAGYTLIREFRKLDKETHITLISADAADFYSKPMLSTALAQGKDAQSLVMTSAEKMAEQLNIEILANTSVTEIDRGNKRCFLSSGKELAYNKLVLALGADPIRIPFDGNANDDVLSVNNIDDYAIFRKKLSADVRRIVIIGAGLIGCEFANDLLSHEYQVDVIGLGKTPLDTLIPAQAGKNLQSALQGAGVNWHLETTIDSLNRSNNGYDITLTNGTCLNADLILSAIGLRAKTDLAEKAGLSCNRAIVVNSLLQTSDESIYALGDCAEVNGEVLPYVMPIMHGARALAKTLVDEPTEVIYPVMPVMVKTTKHPVVVAGNLSGEDVNLDLEAIEQGLKIVATDANDKVIGFCLVGTEANKQKQALLSEMKA